MTYNTNITYSITYTTYNDNHTTTNDYENYVQVTIIDFQILLQTIRDYESL